MSYHCEQFWTEFRLLAKAVLGLCLVLFCSCASAPKQFAESAAPVFPDEVSFNPDAGRGDCVLLNLRLESGKEPLFVFDTGAPFTMVDKSLTIRLQRTPRLPLRSIARVWGDSTSPRLRVTDTPRRFQPSFPLDRQQWSSLNALPFICSNGTMPQNIVEPI